MKIVWSSKYELGINVIDGQHKRIVEYINQLHDSTVDASRSEVADVLRSLVDYTYSHFVFEEGMLEDTDYDSFREHKLAHDTFIKQVNMYKKRFDDGEDVALVLTQFLKNWLLDHILSDDAAYVPAVKDGFL